MTNREEELLAEIKRVTQACMRKEIATMKKKMRELEHARDVWKSQALDYRKQLIEIRSKK